MRIEWDFVFSLITAVVVAIAIIQTGQQIRLSSICLINVQSVILLQ